MELAACACPDRNERIARASSSPHVRIGLGGILKSGDVVIFEEDDVQLRCSVVTNNSKQGEDRYRLKVICKLRPAYIGDAEYPAGEEFDIMQRTDCGAYGGMWNVRLRRD